MSHEPLAIANKVLGVAAERGLPLTIMQLIKLVYFAHGWTLALLGKPLVNGEPQAWQHGPVYPSIYNEFRGSGSRPIERTAKNPFSGTDYEAILSNDEQSVLEQVVAAYGKIHAFELSSRTHQQGTPWDDVYQGGIGKFQPIGNDLIKTHFDTLKRADA
jgi:uncharacterized phage-associated protein